MSSVAPSLLARIDQLTAVGYRGNLAARGLARGLLWRDGVLPPEAPQFSSDLSIDLLDHGFQLLSAALTLRAAQGDVDAIRRALYGAAESLESAARHESVAVTDRGFHLTMAAAAFHIGGYAARAFSLFEGSLASLNLSSPEQALVYLMRRNLVGLRATFVNWLTDDQNGDEAILERLQVADSAVDDTFGSDDVIALALTRHFHQAMATFENAIVVGNQRRHLRAVMMFVRGEQAAAEAKHVPLWWAFRIARHLCDDLWGNSMRAVIPRDGGPPLWLELREKFIRMLISRETAEIDLWPSQLAAARRVVDTTDDLVLALPTSAGKTRIAELCILRALADKRRVIYVTPLRALSAQIEHGLARTFRPLGTSVTSVYGASGIAHSDLETLQSASIVVATPEKLDFAIRQEPEVIDDVGLIVLDEGHMIGLGVREIRYETLVQRLLKRSDAESRRLVCLSAVFTEGEPFDDFTSWLRSDAPGTAVRSTWRPTRQRPGVIRWIGNGGTLTFEVEGERPYVSRFVDPSPATRGRRTAFPNDAQEFLVASALSFLGRGQTVLIYCPEKRSVEPMASAFLKARQQGYFVPQLTDAQTAAIQDVTRIGEEWLGREHPAVQCLSLGVAVHHGSLPRVFLGEVEHLLRRRLLPVCVCSPTLAQGLDLCFGVLLFKSIYRVKETIKPKEFANVVGRVGRAFVDLDGLYILPVFETDSRKANGKVRAFNNLILQAQKRQLESGVRDLVGQLINVLRIKLGCDDEGLAEYVLNASSSWSVAPAPDDVAAQWLDVALNELDSAILGVVDTLELPAEQVADYLDECLQSSYWQRRLKNSPPAERDLQSKVIKGRAKWLWGKTSAESRRAYFASGVGYKAGKEIETTLDRLQQLVTEAENALEEHDTLTAGTKTAELADILYKIGPFAPDEAIGDLPGLLAHWLSGARLSEYPDKSAIGFIQDHIVYRLVWAVESTRLHIQHLHSVGTDCPGELLGLCLTYGVPNKKAALLMQCGVRSRRVAANAASKIKADLPDLKKLKVWVIQLRNGAQPALEWKSDVDQKEWDRFLAKFGHRDSRAKKVKIDTLRATWFSQSPPRTKSYVRVTRTAGDLDALITNVASLPIGTTTWPAKHKGTYLLGRVRKDGKTIRVTR